MLAGVPLFGSVDDAGLRLIEAACAWKECAAGQWVIDHEGGGTEVYVVLRGHLRVIAAAAGREMILRDLSEGEFFGELAALDGKPRSAGILAVTASSLAVVPAKVFRKAIHQHPGVCDEILAVLAGQIRSLANRASETAGMNVRERLGAELLRLSEPSRREPGTMVVSPPPTHAELAARVASHRESITRELNLMERTGLIARRRGAIELPDPERLRRMVEQANAR